MEPSGARMATKEEETRSARKKAVGESQSVSMEEIRRIYRDMTCKETKRGVGLRWE